MSYEENLLNKYNNYTYKWKIMIVDPLNDDGGSKYVLAESGVDNEVGINSVQHDFQSHSRIVYS